MHETPTLSSITSAEVQQIFHYRNRVTVTNQVINT